MQPTVTTDPCLLAVVLRHLDGAPHPGKSGTDSERAARRIAAQAELEDVEPADDDRRRWHSRSTSSCCERCRWSWIRTESSGTRRHSRLCLLYTSDAADEEDSVDLGGRRIIKKKSNIRSVHHEFIE
eukprot:TRINITY_DN59686_c0_g1_i3.p2 TRINITY_DN59686_c0_g1~~TRINITY_DN59686_c0_g1_i3.p2  ORF type:complete len:127 (+),score=12.05 TRINITY_DN59686_c0_g1_i3:209-589(+)